MSLKAIVVDPEPRSLALRRRLPEEFRVFPGFEVKQKLIELIHTAVKGRARYRVDGLFRSPSMKRRLEFLLAKEQDILSCSANPLTGTLLVSYNADDARQNITHLIEHVAGKIIGNDSVPQPPSHKSDAVKPGSKQRNGNTGFAIEPIHTKVKGRARYRISGLYRSPLLKNFLELRLVQEPDILAASANPLTGTLLVSYNSDNSPTTISNVIEAVLSEVPVIPVSGEDHFVDSVAAAGAIEADFEVFQRLTVDQSSLKAAIKRLLFPHDGIMSRAWHLLKKDKVLDFVNSSPGGLNLEAVEQKRRKYGVNRLPESERRGGWNIFVDQIDSLPVYLLGAAAGVSLMTGGVIDAVVVLGVVLANAAIGYKTENEAEKTIESLKLMVQPSTEVMRNGRVQEIPAEAVVLGDILVLTPGSYIAADARVVRSSQMSVDESMLTGESLPVEKHSRTLKRKKTHLAERHNMVFMGTRVTGGEGLAVVTAIGRYTEMGRLQTLLAGTTTPQTPIERQLEKTGDHLVLLFLLVCAMVMGIGFLRGFAFMQMLRTAISLAASAVPEGLPAAATINFALGINRMKQHRVLIRNLQAVETLGAVQTICLDKTGTITRNCMTVASIYADGRQLEVVNGVVLENGGAVSFENDEALEKLMWVCTLCNETRITGRDENGDPELSGSPTEGTLLRLVLRSGFDVQRLRKVHPMVGINRRSEHRLYMSTRHQGPNGGRFVAVKGSPLEVLSLCDWQVKAGEIVALTDDDCRAVEIRNEAMADDALRVLGFACADLPVGASKKDENGLVWLGLVGMSDPIRDGVADLIGAFHQAGIETVMITGDQSTTAYAVARQLDLSGGDSLDILDSTELQQVDEKTMTALAKRVKVYSRVSPADKLKIVQALQSAGRTVAMTGDGINDGPALKAADIGIAMGGSGTDVAREVADIVLEEDNLETLITAVQDGRSTYRNIRKSVHFFLSTNISEIVVMFAALSVGLGSPLNVMQLLWINIISDIFPGIALSMEEPEPDVLADHPRPPDAPLFTAKDYRRMVQESLMISGGAMGSYIYGISRYGVGAKAGTMAFQSLTFAQLLHALSCRSETHRLFGKTRLPANNYLNLAVGGSLMMQLLTIFVPTLRSFLGLSPMSFADVSIAGGSAFAALMLNEASKLSTQRRELN